MCFFNHQWEVVNVQTSSGERLDAHVFATSYYRVKLYRQFCETNVLYKCKKCGKFKNQIIDGIWTKDYFK